MFHNDIQMLVKDITNYPKNNIAMARENQLYDFKDTMVFIDYEDSKRLGTGYSWDPDNAVMRNFIVYLTPVSFTFIGNNADVDSHNFIIKLNIDEGMYLQKKYELTLYRHTDFFNTKRQYDTQWWPLVAFNMQCRHKVYIDSEVHALETVPDYILFDE